MRPFTKVIAVLMAFLIIVSIMPVSEVGMIVRAEGSSNVIRYTVLVLDTSSSSDFYSNGEKIYTADTAIEYVKKSAAKFLSDILRSSGVNYVAVVSFDSQANVVSEFTGEIFGLTEKVDNLYDRNGERDISAGLNAANDMLANVPDGNNIQKNVVLFTTGMTNCGSYEYSGAYDSNHIGASWYNMETDIPLYAYANNALAAAESLKENADLYVIGLFQSMEDMPEKGHSVVTLFKDTAHDIATSDEHYYPVDDPEEIAFVFGEVADEVADNTDIESFLDDFYKNLYIDQHVEYARSEAFKEEIVQGLDSDLEYVIKDISSKNIDLSSYNTMQYYKEMLNLLVSTLEFEFLWNNNGFVEELNKLMTSEGAAYEYLLALILINSAGDGTSVEESLKAYYNDAVSSYLESLIGITSAAEDFSGDTSEFASLLGAAKDTLQYLVPGSDDYNTVIDGIASLINKKFSADDFRQLMMSRVDEIKVVDANGNFSIKKTWDAAKGDSVDRYLAVAGFIFSEAELIFDTAADAFFCIAYTQAYLDTSEMFGDILLGMRRNLLLKSQTGNSVFEPFPTENAIDARELKQCLDVDWYSPWNTNDLTQLIGGFQPIYEIAHSLEDFYTALDNGRFENLEVVASNAYKSMAFGTADLIKDTALKFTISNIYKCFPVLRELEIINGIVNITDALYKLISKNDDKSYLATTVVRLYYLSYILQPTICSRADYSSILADDQDDMLNWAVNFDYAVKIYKSINELAASYCYDYASICLEESTEAARLSATAIENDKLIAALIWRIVDELKAEEISFYAIASARALHCKRTICDMQCHDVGLVYNHNTQRVEYLSSKVKIITIACPVEVTVKTDSGEQIALLSDSGNTIEPEYIDGFFISNRNEESDYGIKVAIIPDNFEVFIDGIDEGNMDVYIADSENGEIKCAVGYCELPVTEDTVCSFTESESYPELMDLVVDGNVLPATNLSEDDEKKEMEAWHIVVIFAASFALVGVGLFLLIRTNIRSSADSLYNQKSLEIPDRRYELPEEEPISEYVYNPVRTDDETEDVDKEKKKAPLATISFLTGELRGCVIPLDDNQVVFIGKDISHVNIVIPRSYAAVSRVHCSVKYDKCSGKFYVTDTSTNGTYYQSGKRLENGKRTVVDPESVLYLANESCTLILKSGESEI